MISFSPLYETLKERGMNISDLRSVLSPDTIANINKNHLTKNSKIYLGTIEKICFALNVPVEKVICFLPDEQDTSDK